MRSFLFIMLISVMLPMPALGQIHFQAPVLAPMAERTHSIVVGDFNGDGIEDVVRQTEEPTHFEVTYYKGLKDFSITPLEITGEFYNPVVMVSDVNKDGIDDLLIRNYDRLVVCIGTTGGFEIKTIAMNVQSTPFGSTITDFNKDNKPDIITSSNGDPIQVALGDGTGNFIASNLNTNANFKGRLTAFHAEDLDHNNEPDFVFMGDSAITVYIKVASSYSKTTYKVKGALQDTYRNSAIADFNSDGFSDIVVVSDTKKSQWDYDTGSIINILVNKGNGTFEEPKILPLGNLHIRHFDHRDFDHDGKEDIVASSYVANPYNGGVSYEWHMFMLRNIGNLTFKRTEVEEFPPQDVRFIDIDGTGTLEIVSGRDDSNMWYKLNGNWERIDTQVIVGIPLTGTVFDMDHDGIKDIVGESTYPSSITIWYGKGNLEFEEPVYIPIPVLAWTINVADFNGDHLGDIVLSEAYGTDDDYYNYGTSIILSTAPRQYDDLEFFFVNQTMMLVPADFDNDGDIDLAEEVAVHFNDGTGHFTSTYLPELPYEAKMNLIQGDAGDFNGDGYIDLVVNSNIGLHIFINDGTGHFLSSETIYEDKNLDNVTVGDLNGDDFDDIISIANIPVTPFNTTDIILLTSDGNGQFTKSNVKPDQKTYTSYLSSAAVADVDNDGITDIVAAFSDEYDLGAAVFRGLPGGGYGDQSFFKEQPEGEYLQSLYKLLLSDLDDDSKIDVVGFSGLSAIIYRNASLPEPTTGAGDLIITPSDFQATISLSKGNGDGRIILIRESSGNSLNFPVDGTFYSAGDRIGNSLVILRDNLESVVATHLKSNTSYDVFVYEYSLDVTNDLINYMSSGPFASFTTLVAGVEGESTSKASLYPNPAANVITISNFSAEPVIYNAVGTSIKVPALPNGNDLQLDTSNLLPGLYIIHLPYTTLKFIKQ